MSKTQAQENRAPGATVEDVVQHPWASFRVIGKKEQAARRAFARRQRAGYAVSKEPHKYAKPSNSVISLKELPGRGRT